MSDIKERISSLCPSATFTEGETLMVTVEDKDWYPLAKALKETPGLEFDVCSAVVGMDWKDRFGVIYYLTSTSRNWEIVAFKVMAADRENPIH